MALAFKVLRYTPANNPDTVELGVTVSGNYVTNGDTANLNPSQYADPNGLGVLGEPLSQPVTPPSVVEENLGGYYANVVPGATLAANLIKFYQPGGAEVAAGAYPAAITGGTLTIRVPLR